MEGLFFAVLVVIGWLAGSGPALAPASCYAARVTVGNHATGQRSVQRSYIRLQPTVTGWAAEGMIWGDNLHLCQLASPVEGQAGPLPLTVQGSRLVYQWHDPDAGIACDFAMLLDGPRLTLDDANGHCRRAVFYCGSRAVLHQQQLVQADDACPCG